MKIAAVIAIAMLLVTPAAVAAQTTYERFIEASAGQPWKPDAQGLVTDSETAIDLAYAIVANGLRINGLGKPDEKRWKANKKVFLESGVWQIYDPPPNAPKGQMIIGGGCSFFIAKADGKYLGGYCSQ